MKNRAHLKKDQLESIRPLYERWQRVLERGYRGTVDAEFDSAQSEYYGAIEKLGLKLKDAQAYFDSSATHR
jgi:hypothetical protein